MAARTVLTAALITVIVMVMETSLPVPAAPTVSHIIPTIRRKSSPRNQQNRGKRKLLMKVSAKRMFQRERKGRKKQEKEKKKKKKALREVGLLRSQIGRQETLKETLKEKEKEKEKEMLMSCASLKTKTMTKIGMKINLRMTVQRAVGTADEKQGRVR
jgi:hypothetical protein